MRENLKDGHVCILGLGYVGLTLAAVMAEAGFHVLGVDINKLVLDRLKKGQPHIYESGLPDILRRAIGEGKIEFAQHIPDDCQASVYVITVGTPLLPNGSCRMDMVENVSREVSNHLKQGDLVIMRSTVKMGTTREVVRPILEASGVGFDLAFCPERTTEGQALAELRQLPQVIGGTTWDATLRAAQLFQIITPTVIRVSDLETAEMIKMVCNIQRDVSFALANEMARICDALGISTVEVVRSASLGYLRTDIPTPGPVGGPCLSKDSHILAEGLKDLGIKPEITMAARRVNERQPEEVVAHLDKVTGSLPRFPKEPIIALLGIAFKGRPPTDDLRGSMAMPTFESLKLRFPLAKFRGYDAVVHADAIEAFGVTACSSIEEALAGAHLVLILNNHVEFSTMLLETLAPSMGKPGLVYDFWNNFVADELALPKGVGYMALGSHGRAVLPEWEE